MSISGSKASLEQLQALRDEVSRRLQAAMPDAVAAGKTARRLPVSARRLLASVDPAFAGAWPIGVDIGGVGVRLLQLRPTELGGAEVIAAQRADLAPADSGPTAGVPPTFDAAVGEAVRTALSRGEFFGRQAVVTLPRRLVQVKTVRLQAGATASDAAQVAAEVQGAFGIDLSAKKHVCHFLPAESLRRGDGREGIAAVANRAEIDRLIANLHACGLHVRAVDFEPLAMLRAVSRFGRRDRDRREAVAVVDLGERSTRVTIGRGGVVSFYKSLAFGGRTIHAAVASALELSESEARLLCLREQSATVAGAGDRVARAASSAQRAVVEKLARELAMCLRYYAVTFQGRPPQRVVVTGGAATDRLRQLLATSLENSLPLQVVPRRAFDDVAPHDADADLASFEPGDDRLWHAALGLALRDAPGRLKCGVGQSRRQQIEADAAADRAVLTLASSPRPKPQPGDLSDTPHPVREAA